MNKGIIGLSESVVLYFGGVEDPRVDGRCRHVFLEMIFISVCAVLCGAESFSEIEDFGKEKEDWLKKFLALENGIPSEDTFRRLFSAINPQVFGLALTEWVHAILVLKKIARLSFDGKTIAGTDRKVNRKGSGRLHLLNVFDHTNGFALAQMPCKSTAATEADAILECLEFLEVEGALISVDAASSSRRVIGKVRDKKADYLCPLKGNNRLSLKEANDVFSTLIKKSAKNIKYAEKKEKSHGRNEHRQISVIESSEMSSGFQELWQDAKCIIRIVRTRETADLRPLICEPDKNGKVRYLKNENKKRTTKEIVFYVTSRKITAKKALKEIRDHWSIENKLHWSLDVAFSEDQWRVRDRNAAANLSAIRKYAFNLIKQCKEKGGQRRKMKRAAWNNDYLEKLIGENQF